MALGAWGRSLLHQAADLRASPARAPLSPQKTPPSCIRWADTADMNNVAAGCWAVHRPGRAMASRALEGEGVRVGHSYLRWAHGGT